MTKISRRRLGVLKYITSPMRIAICAVILVALIAAVGLWSMRTLLFGENFHTVIPKEVYRSAQPSPKALERWIKRLGIRTVINLRGEQRPGPVVMKAEREVTEAQGVDLYNISLSNGTIPPTNALQKLVYVLDTARRPLLLHCAAGIERSGIASAVAVLLAGGDLAEAREQFSLTYGFMPWFHDHPEMLDYYEHWLALQAWSHTPDHFRYWVDNKYVPSFYRALIKPLDVPTSIAEGTPAILRFRATNISPKPWRFRRSQRDRGISLMARMVLLEPGVNGMNKLRGKTGRYLRGRFRDLTVAPSETVMLKLRVPPLRKPGRYQLFVDLVNKDEAGLPFSAMGSEPLIFELRVESSEE